MIGHRARLVLAFFAIQVNAVVALILGHELGGEPIGVRTIVGRVLVLASTIVLLRRREAPR